MLNHVMKLILVLLIIFTPLSWGSADFWAFSSMELAILAILLLWAIAQLNDQRSLPRLLPGVTFFLLLLFLDLVLFQTIPLPAENDFLQLHSEVGLLGLTFLLILFLVLFFKAASGIRSFSLKDPRRYIGIGGLVGILALMFHSLGEKTCRFLRMPFFIPFYGGSS